MSNVEHLWDIEDNEGVAALLSHFKPVKGHKLAYEYVLSIGEEEVGLTQESIELLLDQFGRKPSTETGDLEEMLAKFEELWYITIDTPLKPKEGEPKYFAYAMLKSGEGPVSPRGYGMTATEAVKELMDKLEIK